MSLPLEYSTVKVEEVFLTRFIIKLRERHRNLAFLSIFPFGFALL